ncbi:hypothetical protein D3C83_195120 [compost metagenome]
MTSLRIAPVSFLRVGMSSLSRMLACAAAIPVTGMAPEDQIFILARISGLAMAKPARMPAMP